MHFRYKLQRARQSVVTLGGRWVRPRPIVLVTLIGSADTHVERAILDTAADDTVFPESVAIKLGIDLTHAPAGEAFGVGLAPTMLRYAQVKLRLTDGREYREWTAWVGFAGARLNHSLLGFAGCLQFFDAQFRGGREEVELTINPLYSGT